MQSQPDEATPVAWDPCRPISYAVNPTGGPRGAAAMVASAVHEVSALTGLRFEARGTTDDRPDTGFRTNWIARPRPYDVLVSWADASEVPDLRGPVAGVGGSSPAATTGPLLRYTHGQATLDSDAFAEIGRRPHGRTEQRAIVLHELGHVMGLDHVADPAQLMNADNVGLLDFGDGDRAGLARLGAGRCF